MPNFFDPAFFADPLPEFARLRAEHPVVRVDKSPWGPPVNFVLSHQLVKEVSRATGNFSSDTMELLSGRSNSIPEAEALLADTPAEVGTLLTSDDPAHRRLRVLFNKAFAPSQIKAMGDVARRVVEELVDPLVGQSGCDFLNDIAVPLPLRVIAGVLGFDASHYDRLSKWANALMVRRGQMGTVDQQIEAAALVADCKRFLLDEISKRRLETRDDLISQLIEARFEDERPLTDIELMSNLLDLVIAGHETTRASTVATVRRLLENPDQLQMARSDEKMLTNAIEEAIRYDTPAAAQWRVATTDTQLGGVQVQRGDIVLLRFDAANRDPDVFPDPDRFDLTRTNLRDHVSFGFGIHACIGSQLARLQVHIATRHVLDRFKDMRIDAAKSDLRFQASPILKAVHRFHVTYA